MWTSCMQAIWIGEVQHSPASYDELDNSDGSTTVELYKVTTELWGLFLLLPLVMWHFKVFFGVWCLWCLNSLFCLVSWCHFVCMSLCGENSTFRRRRHSLQCSTKGCQMTWELNQRYGLWFWWAWLASVLAEWANSEFHDIYEEQGTWYRGMSFVIRRKVVCSLHYTLYTSDKVV